MTAKLVQKFRCAHGHIWVMISGQAKRCPHCGTITFKEFDA